MVPVQSGFTVYVPVPVTWRMLPFWLAVAAKVVPPLPSKVCVPTSTNGPAAGDGGAMDPVPVYAKVPCTTALEQPLSSAFAMGVTASASAVTAAIVKAIAFALCFIIISFVFSFYWYRRQRAAKSGHVLLYIFLPGGERV